MLRQGDEGLLMRDVPSSEVAAIIVTRNRHALLKRCLLAVESQTVPPEEVLVVDTGSSDGTLMWLEAHQTRHLRLENVGSAGGFAAGLRYASEQLRSRSYWLMDDDAMPTPACLEHLLDSPAAALPGNIVGSIAVAEDDRRRLAFHIPELNSYSRVLDWYRRTTDDVEYIREHAGPLGYEWGMFFNSVLLPRDAVLRAGVPRPELFIWGDEVEYFYRLRSRGFSTFLIAESVVLHPRAPPGAPPLWKEKYRVRNYVYVHRTYMRHAGLRLLTSLSRILRSRQLTLLRPLWHGIRGDFSARYIEE